jgi:hypothetical protein
MKRLFKLLAALSLLLCVTTVAFWIDSRSAIEDLRWLSYDREHRDIREAEVVYGQGAIAFVYRHDHQTGGMVVDAETGTYFTHYQSGASSTYNAVDALQARYSAFGFVCDYENELIQNTYPSIRFLAVVPFWFLTAVTIVFPAAALMMAIRTRTRRADARCTVCGYDLRATPDRCPECGKVQTSSRGANSASQTSLDKAVHGIERAGDSQPPTTGPSVQFADSMVFNLTYRSPLSSDERSRTRRATARLIALIAFPSLLVAAVAVPRSAAKIEAYRMQRDSEARQRELDELLSRTHLSVLTFEEPAGDSCSTPSSKPAAVMR